MQSVEERQAVPASGRYRDAKAHEKLMEDNLRMKGFEYGGKEEHVFVLLLHLFTAVSMYDELTAYDRKIVDVYQKKFKNIFDSKFSVKQRKRNLKEKKVSPTPLSIDKESPKEKDEKIHLLKKGNRHAELEKRKEAFRQEVFSFSGQFDDNLLNDFFNWFSEENISGTKMRKDAERFWNTKNRLENWKENPISVQKENASIRLEETKKRKSKTQAAAPAEEQKKASAEREAENLKREQEFEENKKKAVSFEEYQKGKKQGGALDKLKNISSTPKK